MESKKEETGAFAFGRKNKMQKEVQDRIVKESGSVTEEEFLGILKLIAPGTHLRAALNGTLKTGKGGLIAIENENLGSLIEGGFRINSRFTPQKLIELTKMDGAIILSKDMKKINYANVLLTPDSTIKTNETGTRHKAAERTAKGTGTLVLAISEKRKEITVYYKRKRYLLVHTDDLLRKTNEHIQILEKQRELFDRNLDKLNYLELRNHESLERALMTIQKGVLVKKISESLKRNIIELGNEGLLLKTRLKEITAGFGKELDYVIKDYTRTDMKKTRAALDEFSYDEVLNKDNILKTLAYEECKMDEKLKGWRILSKTSLSDAEIASLIKETGSLGKAIHSGLKVHESVLGLDKAMTFIEEIGRVKRGL